MTPDKSHGDPATVLQYKEAPSTITSMFWNIIFLTPFLRRFFKNLVQLQ